jgi:hypothetical protein
VTVVGIFLQVHGRVVVGIMMVVVTTGVVGEGVVVLVQLRLELGKTIVGCVIIVALLRWLNRLF